MRFFSYIPNPDFWGMHEKLPLSFICSKVKWGDDFIYILYTIFKYIYKEHTILNNISADYLFNIEINKLLNCYASNKIKLIDSIYI